MLVPKPVMETLENLAPDLAPAPDASRPGLDHASANATVAIRSDDASGGDGAENVALAGLAAPTAKTTFKNTLKLTGHLSHVVYAPPL